MYVSEKVTRCTRPTIAGTGFTVLEILIVLSIMLLLVALTVLGVREYAYRQQFIGFTTEVRDRAQEAKQQTVGAVGDATYGVYVGTSSIEFFSGTVPVVGSAANSIMELPAYLTATSSFANGLWYLSFERLTGVPSTNGSIEFVDLRTLATTSVTISATGLVE